MQKTKRLPMAKQNLFLHVLSKPFFLTALAEGESPAPVPQVNYEQLIAAARKEEKDKLYPQIQMYKTKVDDLVTSLNSALLESGSLKEEVKSLTEKLNKAKEGKDDSEEVKKLTDELSTTKARIEELKKVQTNNVDEIELRESIRAELEKEYAVKHYRTEQLSANRVKIINVFDGEVTGSTNEEIDASIAAAIEKTKQTRAALGLPEEESEGGNNNTTLKTQAPAAATPKKPVKVNPARNQGKSNYTAEDIQNMDVRSEEYKEFRKSLGLK